jgi:hypothetical protein
MGPVRVLGRIDQAQQAYDLLRGAGVEARLSTSAPMAAIAETGQDDTTLDLVVGESLGWGVAKGTHPNRPVVVLAHPAFFPEIEAQARTCSGPDAWAAWPATAEEIVAVCQRAVARAGAPRPRWTRRQIALVSGLVLLGLALPLAWSFGPSSLTQGPRPTRLDRMVRVGQVALFGLYAFTFWRRRGAGSFYKVAFWSCLALAGFYVVAALR